MADFLPAALPSTHGAWFLARPISQQSVYTVLQSDILNMTISSSQIYRAHELEISIVELPAVEPRDYMHLSLKNLVLKGIKY